MDAAALSPAGRRSALDRLGRDHLDVLVIGGGVTGAGIALDAATRGLSVGLVEQRDLASGTSSRSSKLIHGGLRYLEQLDLPLVREALRERGRILHDLAPHLTRPVSFVYPVHSQVERAYVGAGLLLYDSLGGRGQLPPHRHLGRRGTAELVPGLRLDGLAGAVRYWDAQLDDARHTMELARTAASYGAAVATSARVTDLTRDGDRIVGAVVRDQESGREIAVRAHHVVNATGVWAGRIQDLAGRGRIRVLASKGIHLVVPRERIVSRSGMILRTETSVLFVIPFGAHWIVGTTDTAWTLDLAHPAASASDIQYLLDRVNRVLRSPLTQRDVIGVYAGLRPLLRGESAETSELSREHAVERTMPGLFTVAGGKYTTYRVMAEDAVDAVVDELDRDAARCITARVPTVGAAGYRGLWNGRDRIAEQTDLKLGYVERLLRRYGGLTGQVLDLAEDRPELRQPIPGAPQHLLAEAVYAATHEGALHLDDILTRRTRVSVTTADRGVAAARTIAPLVAPVLGWDEDDVARELHHYQARVEAELESQRMPDDRTADAARMGAPDVRTGTPG